MYEGRDRMVHLLCTGRRISYRVLKRQAQMQQYECTQVPQWRAKIMQARERGHAGAELLEDTAMSALTAYDEVLDFIAATNPNKVLAFRPSEATTQRVSELIYGRRPLIFRPRRKLSWITTCG